MTKSQQIESILDSFDVGSESPHWSSEAVRNLFLSTVSDDVAVSDIFESLFSKLPRSRLTVGTSNFIQDLTKCAFTNFRESYQSSNFGWMSHGIVHGCTPSQAYLALYALPPELLTPECIVALLKALDDTPFWPEAVANLEDELSTVDHEKLLKEWLDSDDPPSAGSDVERLIATCTG